MRTIPQRLGRTLLALLGEFLTVLRDLALRGYGFVEHWLLDSKKALYGLAVTRILFGVMALGILAANWSTRLYAYGAGSAWTGQAAYPGSDFAKIWLFSWFHSIGQNDVLLTLSYLGLFVLAGLLAVGWRTRFVLPAFLVFYVSWIEMNDVLSDQSDNLLRMVLIYMLFADPAARLSLDARRRLRSHESIQRSSIRAARFRPYSTLLHNLVIVIITLHVGLIYMSGALYKAQGQTWSTGYAVYNPLHVARFSTWPEIADLLTKWGPMVVAISWGTIVIQMMFLPMLINRVTRIVALLGVMAFHLGIGVLMGLPFFSMAMIAVDAIFVRDVTWQHMGRAIAGAWRRATPRATDPAERSDALEAPVSETGSSSVWPRRASRRAAETAAPVDALEARLDSDALVASDGTSVAAPQDEASFDSTLSAR